MNASALDQLAVSFRLLVAEPSQCAVDGHAFDGLPDRRVGVAELSDLLLDPATSAHARDRVWAHLVRRARHDGPEWTVIAAGLALPGLRRAAARVVCIWPHGDAGDREAEVLAGFLTALADVDIRRPRVCSRLCQAAWSAGRSWARRQIRASKAVRGAFESRTPPPPYGHVDLVMARAVTEGVLTRTDATLVSATRLDGDSLTATAETVGVSAAEARLMRKHAEAALVDWLADAKQS